jgi:hypothetical protein
MTGFKKIKLSNLEHLEVNREGYILDPSTGQLEIGGSFFIEDRLVTIEEIIKNAFENEKIF